MWPVRTWPTAATTLSRPTTTARPARWTCRSRSNFFGTTYTYLFVNNNGNVTFRRADGHLHAVRHHRRRSPPIIAPFFADVDTRGAARPRSPTRTARRRTTAAARSASTGSTSATTPAHTDKLNSFQLLLVDRSDRGAGDFDIVFNYDSIQWETGDASGGSGGFGGTPAAAGFSAGTGAQAPSSSSPARSNGCAARRRAALARRHSTNSLVPGATSTRSATASRRQAADQRPRRHRHQPAPYAVRDAPCRSARLPACLRLPDAQRRQRRLLRESASARGRTTSRRSRPRTNDRRRPPSFDIEVAGGDRRRSTWC